MYVAQAHCSFTRNIPIGTMLTNIYSIVDVQLLRIKTPYNPAKNIAK